MHTSLDSPEKRNQLSSLGPWTTEISVKNLLTLLSLPDAESCTDCAETLKVYNFRLGDEIIACSPSTESVEDLNRSHSYNQYKFSDLYWICQGRVRLLCSRADRQREVSALLLESNQTFGADRLFLANPLPLSRCSRQSGANCPPICDRSGAASVAVSVFAPAFTEPSAKPRKIYLFSQPHQSPVDRQSSIGGLCPSYPGSGDPSRNPFG